MIMKKEKMDRILAKLPKDPPDTEAWVRENCVLGKYLIYDIKEDIAVCTSCGEWIDNIDMLKGAHGEETVCPHCMEDVTALSKGRGRIGRTEYFRLLLLNRREKTVYGTLWEYTVDFTMMGPPRLSRWLSAVYTANAKERHYYKHYPTWFCNEERWEERKTFRIPHPVHAANGPMSKFIYTWCRTDNLEEVFKKSDMRYMWIDGYVQNLPPEEMIQYIRHGLMHRSVELLLKAGFTDLVWEKISQEPCGGVNWQGKTLQRILKLPPRHVKMMQRLNPTPVKLRTFQSMTESERDAASLKTVRIITDYCTHRNLDQLREKVEEYIPFRKWIQYMNEQAGERIYADTWIDYIRMCRSIGVDLRRKRNLLPEDLRTAHDMAVATWHEQKDEKMNEGIREMARTDTFSLGELTILPADSQKKLSQESAALNHCVKTYGRKIASGKCWIWFIRKTENPETPYYTMETDTDGNMRQCRGDHNKDATPEVKQFATEFERFLKRELKKERATT